MKDEQLTLSQLRRKYSLPIMFRQPKNYMKPWSHYKKIRGLLLKVIGNTCKCTSKNCWHDGPCNVIDKRCIQIDFINGGHTKEVRESSNYGVLLRLLRDPNRTKKVQPLCANCNWVKKVRNKE